MCDALMGVVVTELYRDQTPERVNAVKTELISIIQERIGAVARGTSKVTGATELRPASGR